MTRWATVGRVSVKVMSIHVVPVTGLALRCDNAATARFVVCTLLVGSRWPARGPSVANAAAITSGSAYRDAPLVPAPFAGAAGAFSEPNALMSTRCEAE